MSVTDVPATQPQQKKSFPTKTPPEIEAKIVEMSRTGLYTQQAIADAHSVSAHTVGRIEEEHGLKRRPHTTRRKASTFDLETIEGCKAAIAYHKREQKRTRDKLGGLLQKKMEEVKSELDALNADLAESWEADANAATSL